MNEFVVISHRIEKAKEYLTILEETLHLPWIDLYVMASTHENWLYRLAAVHPLHYDGYVQQTDSICQIRGKRSMPKDAGIESQRCRSFLIWGYECHLHDAELVADHLFPFSLGGPSVGENKIFLCHMHNSVKSSDVHLYPWERGEPAWVRLLLERIYTHRTR